MAVMVGVLGLLSARAVTAEHGMEGGADTVRSELAESVHRNLGCGSCHGMPEHAPAGGPQASCGGCHERAAAAFARGPHGVALRRGASDAPTCVSCHGSHGVKPARAEGSPASPWRVPVTCGRCHRQAADEFMASAHGRALVARAAGAPSCAACHGAHEAAGALTPSSRVARSRVADTCGTCHVEARLEFGRSVHGTAVVRGVLHAPTCTTCHGVHAIPAPQGPRSPTSTLRVAGETCARCHASVRITEMHDLPDAVVQDFRGSFHGLAGAAGDRRVANCASCHGFHEIRPSSSPFSRTNPENLGRTCGECHPGAGARFARGGIHHTDRSPGHRLVGWVGSMYAGMIVVIIGLMAVHDGIDFQRRWRDRRSRGSTPDATASAEVLRFTVNERVQHWMLAGSFVALALTGFALRFGWRLPLLDRELQEAWRAGIHRGAAIVMVGLGIYHVGYLALTARGRRMARAILPRVRTASEVLHACVACLRLGPPSRSDWRELIGTLKYNLGRAAERPAYGRFTYWEKMEYWALLWGTIVMATTGVVLWLEVPFLNRFPYWAWELFQTVHFYEATLAVLAILVWHFYFTIVNPDVFPLSPAMTRGTLTHEEMEREHPLDLESRSGNHESDESDRCVHGVGGGAGCRICHPDEGVEPGAGPSPGGGEAADREARRRGGPPQADGEHQGS